MFSSLSIFFPSQPTCIGISIAGILFGIATAHESLMSHEHYEALLKQLASAETKHAVSSSQSESKIQTLERELAYYRNCTNELRRQRDILRILYKNSGPFYGKATTSTELDFEICPVRRGINNHENTEDSGESRPGE